MADMERIGYKDVLVSADELFEISNDMLTKGSIAVHCHRYNRGKSQNWKNQPDLTDSRRVLIFYTTIPKQTKAKYNLPDVSVLIDRFKEEKASNVEEEKRQQKDLLIIELEGAIQSAAADFSKYNKKFNALFPGKAQKVTTMAKTHSVLTCCLTLWNTGKYSIAEIHAVYKKLKDVKQLKNEEVFRRRLKAWTESGEINIVHAYTGTPRKHLLKVTPWHIAKTEQYYSNAQQFTVKTIHELLTAECKKYNKTIVSRPWVAKYLSSPEVRNRLSVFRNQEYYRRKIQPSARRLAPTYAADLYYADGSPLQIPCWNEANTKVIRLNLFAVMDVKSKNIVGYDLAETEDRFTWLSAFKMAFSTQQLLPYEVMYDNATATKTPEFETLKNELLLKGCTLNPTTKGEPKQKANIERWFNTFQTGFQRSIEGFVGEGIRTKRDNGRIDVEHLQNLQKTKGYYTYSQMVEIAANLISIYNSKPTKKAASPNKVYSESEKPNAIGVNHADIALLFWKHKTLKVKNSEVVMTVRHNEYYYEVYDHATALKLDTTQVKVYYDETDLSSVHLFNLKGQYLTECRQKVGFHQAKANQTEADILQIIKQSKHNDAKKTVAKKISAAIAAAGMEGNEEAFLQTFDPYELGLKDAANDAETAVMLNYIQQQTGVQFNGEYKPVRHVIQPEKGRNKPTLQERHAKKNIVPATLEVIERPK